MFKASSFFVLPRQRGWYLLCSNGGLRGEIFWVRSVLISLSPLVQCLQQQALTFHLLDSIKDSSTSSYWFWRCLHSPDQQHDKSVNMTKQFTCQELGFLLEDLYLGRALSPPSFFLNLICCVHEFVHTIL